MEDGRINKMPCFSKLFKNMGKIGKKLNRQFALEMQPRSEVMLKNYFNTALRILQKKLTITNKAILSRNQTSLFSK